MGNRTFDKETVKAFLENNVCAEGIVVDELFNRWNRKEFTDEEIAWAKNHLEEHGMPEEQSYGQNSI